jgi:nucleoside-diphosphate-sugar epimerase
MSRVVLTGSSGFLGRRVAVRLLAGGRVGRVVGLDREPWPTGERQPTGLETRVVDLAVDDLSEHLRGATSVVHLASGYGVARSTTGGPADAVLVERLLKAASVAGVAHVVLVSSATVYGAWPDNPIPLTEDSPVRPNPGFAFARDKADAEATAERLAGELGIELTILRPTTAVEAVGSSWVARAVTAAAGLRVGDVDPPVQFLHFDDLASATALVTERRLTRVFNVAPDGWIPPDTMRALAGRPRPRVPIWVARRLVGLRWRLGLSPTPPEVLPWVVHPWVVANDRLRAAGWEPAFSNEEAYVAATAPGPLDTLSPKRRQELALGVTAVALASVGAAAVVMVRRALRRRRG